MTCKCKKKRKAQEIKDICNECKHQVPGKCCPKIGEVKIVVSLKKNSFDCSGFENGINKKNN